MMTSLYAEKKTRKAEKKTCTANVAACGCIRKQQDFHSGRGAAGLGLGADGVREASSKIGFFPSFSAIFFFLTMSSEIMSSAFRCTRISLLVDACRHRSLETACRTPRSVLATPSDHILPYLCGDSSAVYPS